MSGTDKPVLLFDGVCNLCTGSVIFIIKRDPKAKLMFASLQSTAGQQLLKRFHLSTDGFSSFVLIERERYYTKSAAALRVAKYLKWPWPLLYVFTAVPRSVRDFMYNSIAKNRYKWFGRRDACMVPTPNIRSRFLE